MLNQGGSLVHVYNDGSVSVSTGGAQEVILRLGAGDADLLVIYSSPTTRLLIDPLRYESLTLAREILLPVVAADAKGRPKFKLAAANAATPTPWLAFSQSLTLRGVLAKHLAGLPRKVSLRMVYEADSYESIHEMRAAASAWPGCRSVWCRRMSMSAGCWSSASRRCGSISIFHSTVCAATTTRW